MKRGYANLLLIIVAIVWGGGFIATDGALDSFTPFWMMSIRFTLAGGILVCVSFKQLRTLTKKQLGMGMIAGIFLFLSFAFQTIGLQYTTPSKNAFLTAVNVVFVPYLLWIIVKKRPTLKEAAASIICVVGVAFLTLEGSSLMLSKGDVLSIICALFFSLHMISLERFSKCVPPLSLTALQLLSAGVISTVLAIPFEPVPSSVSSSAFGSLLFLIFASTLFAYLLQTIAQKYTSANTTSLILSMEALFATLFSFLFLGEHIRMTMIIGGILIFSSVVMLEWKKSAKEEENVLEETIS